MTSLLGAGIGAALDAATANTDNTSTSTTPSSAPSSTTSSTSPASNSNSNGGTSNGAAGNSNAGSSQANQPSNIPAPAPPPVVATLTSTGDGVLVHRYNGSVVNGYAGQPLRLHEVVEVIGPPGQPTNANPATIDWLAGGTSQIYDAKPQQFVPGVGFVGRVHTQVSVNNGPPLTFTAFVLQGWMRFFFPPGQTKRNKFEASTGTVKTTVQGTDFTVGYDPDTRTSAVFVTKDSVDVTPVNASLQPFRLSAGQQVEVTPDQVGTITPLSNGATTTTPATQPAKSGSGTSVGLIAGVVGGLLAVAGLIALLLVHLYWRRPEKAPAEDQTPADTAGPTA